MAVKDRSISQTLDLAKRAQRRGAIDEARALYESALARFPANRRAKQGVLSLDAPAPSARGVDQRQVDAVMALYRKGAYQQALKQATALHLKAPEMAAPRDIRAACLRALGQSGKALQLYQTALKTQPDDPQLWRNCGAALSDLQKHAKAEGCFVKACNIAPDMADLWFALAQCRERQGHHRVAYQAATRAVELDPGNADALNLLGALLRELGEIELACQTHEQVLTTSNAAAPQSHALTNLGILAAARGDIAAAKAHYETAIATAPENIQAHRNLARLTHYSPEHPHLAQLRDLVTKPSLSPADKVLVNFALFEALDQTGDYEQAFAHLKRGNDLRKAQLRYDIARDASLFKHIKTLMQAPPAPPNRSEGPRPIFIVGMPRSGTTLTERILGGADNLHSAGEIPALSNAASATLRQLRAENRKSPTTTDLATFEASLRAELKIYARGSAVITCKTPLDFRWVGLALAAMPDAHVVHLVRDPVETCWSNYRTCFTSDGNGFAYNQTDVATFLHLQNDLMQTWKARFPDRILTLSYADLVTDFETRARALVDFCGLHWSEACLHPDKTKAPVLTASAVQVRKPLYNGDRRDWQRYESFLEPMIKGLCTPAPT
jgi:tetratricopeptide (TPR) repeat protein